MQAAAIDDHREAAVQLARGDVVLEPGDRPRARRGAGMRERGRREIGGHHRVAAIARGARDAPAPGADVEQQAGRRGVAIDHRPQREVVLLVERRRGGGVDGLPVDRSRPRPLGARRRVDRQRQRGHALGSRGAAAVAGARRGRLGDLDAVAARHHVVAVAAQLRQVALHRGLVEHQRVHRRRDHHGHLRAQRGGRDHAAMITVSQPRERGRRRRAHHDHVGPRRERQVRHRLRRIAAPQRAHHPAMGDRLERRHRGEAQRAAGRHHLHVAAAALQRVHQGRRRHRADRSRDRQHHAQRRGDRGRRLGRAIVDRDRAGRGQDRERLLDQRGRHLERVRQLRRRGARGQRRQHLGHQRRRVASDRAHARVIADQEQAIAMLHDMGRADAAPARGHRISATSSTRGSTRARRGRPVGGLGSRSSERMPTGYHGDLTTRTGSS